MRDVYIIGAHTLMSGRARQRGQLAFFAIGSGVVVFLMTPASQPVWEAIPMLPYFQFPWRLLGAAAALLAVLGGAGVAAPLGQRQLALERVSGIQRRNGIDQLLDIHTVAPPGQ